jgi:hypothetical protein
MIGSCLLLEDISVIDSLADKFIDSGIYMGLLDTRSVI